MWARLSSLSCGEQLNRSDAKRRAGYRMRVLRRQLHRQSGTRFDHSGSPAPVVSLVCTQPLPLAILSGVSVTCRRILTTVLHFVPLESLQSFAHCSVHLRALTGWKLWRLPESTRSSVPTRLWQQLSLARRIG